MSMKILKRILLSFLIALIIFCAVVTFIYYKDKETWDLIRQLEKGDQQTQVEAEERLGKMGKPAVPKLVFALKVGNTKSKIINSKSQKRPIRQLQRSLQKG